MNLMIHKRMRNKLKLLLLDLLLTQKDLLQFEEKYLDKVEKELHINLQRYIEDFYYKQLEQIFNTNLYQDPVQFDKYLSGNYPELSDYSLRKKVEALYGMRVAELYELFLNEACLAHLLQSKLEAYIHHLLSDLQSEYPQTYKKIHLKFMTLKEQTKQQVKRVFNMSEEWFDNLFNLYYNMHIKRR